MTYQVSKTTDQLHEEYDAPKCNVLAFQTAECITVESESVVDKTPGGEGGWED